MHRPVEIKEAWSTIEVFSTKSFSDFQDHFSCQISVHWKYLKNIIHCVPIKSTPKQIAEIQLKKLVSFVWNVRHDNCTSSQEGWHISLEKTCDNVNFINMQNISLKRWSLQQSSKAIILILKVNWIVKIYHQKAEWNCVLWTFSQ